MSLYEIPRNFKAGEYKFDELSVEGETLAFEYNEEWQLLTYNAPMYENEVRVYTVPRELMPSGLRAVYDKNGALERVELAAPEGARLMYAWFRNIMVSERSVLKYVKEQADKISDVIIKKKQTLSRLFVSNFYDGEAVEIGVKTATAEETAAVVAEYDGDLKAADNSGNYPVENMMQVDYKPLAVMMMCTQSGFRSMLFAKAVRIFEERIQSRVLKKIKTTDDFKFISEQCD